MRLWAATHESVSGPMGGERGCSMASGARGCYPAVVRHGNGLARRERVEQDDGVLAHGGGGVAVQDDHRIAWAESGRGRRHRERREQRHGCVMRSLGLRTVSAWVPCKKRGGNSSGRRRIPSEAEPPEKRQMFLFVIPYVHGINGVLSAERRRFIPTLPTLA